MSVIPLFELKPTPEQCDFWGSHPTAPSSPLHPPIKIKLKGKLRARHGGACL